MLLCLGKVLQSRHVAELIIVDDFSSDGTRKLLKEITDSRVNVLLDQKNLGKDAALRTALASVTAPFLLFKTLILSMTLEIMTKFCYP